MIKRTKPIGGGRKGRVGSEASGKLKVGQDNDLDSSSSGVPSVIQSTWWAKTAIKSSLVSHVILLMSLRAKKCFYMIDCDDRDP